MFELADEPETKIIPRLVCCLESCKSKVAPWLTLIVNVPFKTADEPDPIEIIGFIPSLVEVRFTLMIPSSLIVVESTLVVLIG